MSKFRKKPIEIEAFQMTFERRQDNSDWPNWLHEAWNKESGEDGCLFPSLAPNSDGNDTLSIITLEGVHEVLFDDWIIRGVKGELYPCKPDIFEATYESVKARGGRMSEDWKDTTTYSQSDKERIPTTWSRKLSGVRLTVTRGHIYYPDKWAYMAHPLFDVRELNIPTDSEPEEAMSAAFQALQRHVRPLAEELGLI